MENSVMQEAFDKLTERKKEIMSRIEPLREKQAMLRAKIAEIEKEEKIIVDEIMKIQKDENLYQLDNDRAAAARQLPGHANKKFVNQ